ncbi:pentapeptide repeat-containing protein [Citromicrobium sp. JLT1363]|uniref:pentapeptide repeat-containing protein n=1 Tax=Citromicrobium sp. JLT1363 TaxID=517722 RepID=UPI000225E99E|nr:pentapeptide repeat-containing protein [Citromicrobium sp. JLT1363]
MEWRGFQFWKEEFWSWRHPRRFRFRIWARVRWLKFRQWLREPKFRALRRHWPRPAIIILTAALVAWVVFTFFGNQSGGLLMKLDRLLSYETVKMNWREATQLLLVLVGLPIAFLLWLFRDIHTNAVLENQRKDVNLKEFQEIQMRAAGAMDEKLPASARETSQIAATHQLAGFLRGEYGVSFQRPAWELLRARLLASSERMGYRAILAQIEDWRRADPGERQSAKQLGGNVRKAAKQITQDNTGKSQRDAVRDEWRTIFSSRLPLPDTVFDGIALPPGALLATCDLSRCSFIGVHLWDAHLEGAELWGAHLEGSSLGNAHLEGASLRGAHLEGAFLGNAHLKCASLFAAHLEGANLFAAHLEGADLGRAHLEGADLRYAHLEGADLADPHLDDKTELDRAIFDDRTRFAFDWSGLTKDEKDRARAPWIERGLIHVNDRNANDPK